LFCSLAYSARAAQLDDAVAAAHRGEYAVAFQLIAALAEKGDARAQFNIGYMYANGWGVQRDVPEWKGSSERLGARLRMGRLGGAARYTLTDGQIRDADS
jgi:TPR repeat protein